MQSDNHNLSHFSFVRTVRRQPMALHSRSTMLALSHVIEDAAGANPETRLIATFQRFSLYRPQAERYRRLAARCPQIFVLGIPDVIPDEIPGISLIALESNWPLIHEWVVIAWGPTCTAALIARDIEQNMPHRHSKRFQGLWTTKIDQVDDAVAAFYKALRHPLPAITRDVSTTYRTNVAIQKSLRERLRRMN